MKRLERLTALLIRFQTRDVLTADRLAEDFGVSIRTIYRDVDALQAAGVPIGSEPGTGYFLTDDYRLPPVALTEKEAESVFFAETVIRGSSASFSEEFCRAADKIRTTYSHSILDRLFDNERVIAGDVRKSAGDLWLSELKKAVLDQNAVSFRYVSPYKMTSDKRIVFPLKLYYSGHNWYLVSFEQEKKDYRIFRLSRMENLLPENHHFNALDFRDPAKVIREAFSEKSRQSVTAVFDISLGSCLDEFGSFYGLLNRRESLDGIHADFLVYSEESFARWIVSFGSRARAVAPESLLERCRSLAAEIVRQYPSTP